MSFAKQKTVRKQDRALVDRQDAPNSYRIGQKVVVIRNMGKLENATIRFIGETKFYSGVTWFGVELENPTGKNNGSVHGHRYFRCAMNHGLFVRREMISHAGWGRQTTSKNEFVPDNRRLLGNADDEDVDDARERGIWAVNVGDAGPSPSHRTTTSLVRNLFSNKKDENRKRIQTKAQRTAAYYTNVPVSVGVRGIFKGLDSDQGAHRDALMNFKKKASRAWYHETDPSLIGIGQQLEQLERIKASLMRPTLPRKEKVKALADWSNRAAQLKLQTQERLHEINELLARLPEVIGGSKTYVPPTILKTSRKARPRAASSSSEENDGSAQSSPDNASESQSDE